MKENESEVEIRATSDTDDAEKITKVNVIATRKSGSALRTLLASSEMYRVLRGWRRVFDE